MSMRMPLYIYKVCAENPAQTFCFAQKYHLLWLSNVKQYVRLSEI